MHSKLERYAEILILVLMTLLGVTLFVMLIGFVVALSGSLGLI